MKTQTSHPLQSEEWGKFREKTKIKVIKTKSFQLTIHKIPHSKLTIGYLPKGDLPNEEMIEELKKIGEVEVSKNMTIVCLVGHNIMNQKGYIHKVFEALNYFPLRMISYGGSMHNISILIPSEEKKAVLEALHKSLF